jgi:beta-D-xylosidase 4
MCKSRILFVALLLVIIKADNLTFPDCRSGPLSKFSICDQSLPARQRAIDLISRMTTAKKITQLVHKVPAILRLGLPEIIWWSEALHGIAYSSRCLI